MRLRQKPSPYPFQANTFGLPREIVLDCLLGLLKAKHPEDFGFPAPTERPRHFREWVERYFGEGIARHFMVPYNEKLLGVSLDHLEKLRKLQGGQGWLWHSTPGFRLRVEGL